VLSRRAVLLRLFPLVALAWALASALAWALAPGAAAAPTAFVRVNQAGFAPGEPQRALLLSETPRAGARYLVSRRRGGVALRGGVGKPLGRWSRRFPYVYPVDLSGLTGAGTYTVRAGGASSPPLRLAGGAALYGRLLGNAISYYESVRDGADVIPGPLHRRASHLRDRSAPVYAKPRYNGDGELLGRPKRLAGTVDVSGGWFDAGDYVKFVHTTAYVTAVMLLAIRDDAARFPAGSTAVAEARFGIDWLLRMWDDSTRTLYFQVGIGDGNGDSILGDHDFWRLPQADDRLRLRPGSPNALVAQRPALRAGPPGSPVSPNLAGRLAAAFGLCAQLFRAADPAYANRCLLAGEHVFDLARTSHVGQLLSAVPHAYYPESEWRDDLELGAAELARALGSADPGPHYFDEAERWANAYAKRPDAGVGPLDVYDVSALAHAELAAVASPPGRARLAGELRKALDRARPHARAEPFGLGLAPGGFDTAPHALGYAVTADLYEGLTGSKRFAAFGQRQLDWVLGANAWGASFVVGAGRSYPRCMQSQISNLSGSLNGRAPLQLGATVGGPNSPDVFEGLGFPDGARRCPARGGNRYRRFDGHGARFVDDMRSWPTVEPAIDYTALTMLAFAHRAAH
jgi:endoglucanase